MLEKAGVSGEGEIMAILTRRTSGARTSTLRNRVKGASRDFFLVHVTSVGAAREIIRAGKIETRVCKVFDRQLVYFFAMRPAYKLRGADVKREIIDYFPFVFLVSAKSLGVPFHVYPFDTGGALDGAFDDGASPFFYLEDYALDESLQAVNNHVEWAFGTAANYFDGALRADFTESIPDWDVGPYTFAKIARLASVGSNRPDLRSSAIEIAYERHVPLSEVEFAIVPNKFLEDPRGVNTEMTNKLEAADVKWRSYEWHANRTPADFQFEINQLVRAHLKSCGQI